MEPDVTIVGCGLAGLHAAYPLVQAGFNVRMLDAGEKPRKKFGFGYPLLGWRAGYARLRKENGNRIVESFVPGGLSEIWGGVCERFDATDLLEAGLPDLSADYDIVSERIGLRGTFVEYRGHTTLEELRHHTNFEYREQFVTSIPERSGIVILACGAVQTAKLLGKSARFYKANTLYACLTSKRLPLGGLRSVAAYPVGRSYVILYSFFPFTAVLDLRGPAIALGAQRMLPFFKLSFAPGNACHYAGGVDVDESGKYAEQVYVADSAGWKGLPAKPIALTIMANANRIGTHVAGLLGGNR